MKLTNYHKSYLPEDNYINFHHNIGEGFRIRSDLYIVGDKFVQYQKDLIEEFFADLVNNYDFTNFDEQAYHKFIKHFEFAIEDLNSKLAVFAQKVKDVKKMEIKGIIEIIFEKNYSATLIGSTSLLIFRDDKIYFSFDNESDNSKIDLFSEFIEGDIHNGDKLVLAGTNLSEIIDEQDMNNISELMTIEDKNIIDILEELLSTRVTTDFIKFLQYTDISIPSENIAKNFINNKGTNISNSQISNYINKYKHNIGIGLITIIAFLSTIYLVYSFYSQKEGIVLVNSDKTAINFTIQDIQNDISSFQKMDPSSPDKIKKYKDISEKISLLEKSGKLPNDVFQLKKLFQENYLQSFNISSISNLSNKIYSLTQNDTNHLGDLIKLSLGKNNYNIGGTKGTIIGLVSDTVLGSNVKPNSAAVTYKSCSNNIQKNGLYCRDSANNIYNITKGGVSLITTKATSKFANIIDLGTYGNNNMYILTDEGYSFGAQSSGNANGSAIYRYQIIGTNQNAFREPLVYKFDTTPFKDGLSKLSIDGSFLFRNPTDKKIYQIRRDTKAAIQTRQVNIQGGVEDLLGNYSSKVSIYSFVNSPYLYIYDPDSKSITTYISSPSKSSDGNQYSFSLTYLFRLNLQITDPIIDLEITDGIKPDIYILKSDGIYHIKFSDFLETYVSKKNNLAQ